MVSKPFARLHFTMLPTHFPQPALVLAGRTVRKLPAQLVHDSEAHQKYRGSCGLQLQVSSGVRLRILRYQHGLTRQESGTLMEWTQLLPHSMMQNVTDMRRACHVPPHDIAVGTQ